MHGQVHLTLLHTADIHSRLFPYNLQLGQIDAGLGLGSTNAVVNVGGAARVSYVIGRERARSSRVLHLDGGDCFQGAPIFNFFSGEAEMRTQSRHGHRRDGRSATTSSIAARVNLAQRRSRSGPTSPSSPPTTSSTIRSKPGASPLGTVIQPFTVFDLDGLKVGVIGMGNLSSLTSHLRHAEQLRHHAAQHHRGRAVLRRSPAPLVDVVVVVTHLGLDVDETMIETTTGIDVVLGGHNHIVLQPPKQVQDCSANYETCRTASPATTSCSTIPTGERRRRREGASATAGRAT